MKQLDINTLSRDDLVKTFTEIELTDADDFLKIKETLTRIGMQSGNKELTQTAHILHKNNKYYIVHAFEMLALDGKKVAMTAKDKERVLAIVNLLTDWNLCKTRQIAMNFQPLKSLGLVVLSYDTAKYWTLKSNYTI